MESMGYFCFQNENHRKSDLSETYMGQGEQEQEEKEKLIFQELEEIMKTRIVSQDSQVYIELISELEKWLKEL